MFDGNVNEKVINTDIKTESIDLYIDTLALDLYIL
jgi:hypothetical protein